MFTICQRQQNRSQSFHQTTPKIDFYVSLYPRSQTKYVFNNKLLLCFFMTRGREAEFSFDFHTFIHSEPSIYPTIKKPFPPLPFWVFGGGRANEGENIKKFEEKPLAYKLKTKWKIDVYLIPFPKSLTLYLLRLPARPNQPSARPLSTQNEGKLFCYFIVFIRKR